MFNHFNRLGLHCLVSANPKPFPGFQDKSVFRPHFLYGLHHHVCLGVPSRPKVDPHRFSCISLAWLGHTSQVFTEPDFKRSLCAPYILRAIDPEALTTVLLAGHSVDHPWCCACDAGADGVGVPSVVAGV